MTLTFRFRGWNSTARNVCAECHRYTGVSREAPWEMTAVRIPTVVLPEIPAVPTSTFNHTRIHTHITHVTVTEHMLNRLRLSLKTTDFEELSAFLENINQYDDR